MSGGLIVLDALLVMATLQIQMEVFALDAQLDGVCRGSRVRLYEIIF